MSTICVIGDTHGHLQLGLCIAARWQRELGTGFEAVCLCGDVGTFAHEDQLDSATRAHSKANPCELEFLFQWSANPQPEWLGRIFRPADAGGLGLCCPVVMVHGNHEGFAPLEPLARGQIPDEPVELTALPSIEQGRHLRYLPSGWRCHTPAGRVVAGVKGIEPGQRRTGYHPMAYINEAAVAHLLDQPPVDLLITHQGPSALQGSHGSDTLQLLLDAGIAGVWCHGHSIPHPEIVRGGPRGSTWVVPLGDIAFATKGPRAGEPGRDGWAVIDFEPEIVIRRERPSCWREYRRHRWMSVSENLLVCPDLADWTYRSRGV